MWYWSQWKIQWHHPPPLLRPANHANSNWTLPSAPPCMYTNNTPQHHQSSIALSNVQQRPLILFLHLLVVTHLSVRFDSGHCPIFFIFKLIPYTDYAILILFMKSIKGACHRFSFKSLSDTFSCQNLAFVRNKLPLIVGRTLPRERKEIRIFVFKWI